MKIHVELDRDNLIYTSCETISGKIVVESKSPLNISSIKATLSGISVSRLRSGEGNEVHQVCVTYTPSLPYRRETTDIISYFAKAKMFSLLDH